MLGKKCQTKNLKWTISYDKVTCLVDVGKTVDVIYLHFSNDSDTVFCNILLEKLTFHGVEWCEITV